MKLLCRFSLFLLILTTAFFSAGCGDDDDPVSNPLSNINILVKSASDSGVVAGANVVLHDAANGNAVARTSSGADGIAKFESVTPGTFFVRITAQNYKELPQPNISPVPFSTSAGQTASAAYYLTPLPGQSGSIGGSVIPKVAGVLIKATNGTNSYSSYTGPDGYYVLFNVGYGTYTLSAAKLGYRTSSEPQVTLSQNQQMVIQDLQVTPVTGNKLTGSVSFLAVNNGIVDVSILDKQTRSAITGLSTKIDSSRNYSLTGIPKGEYLAWASYQNDGYVMDPDWIYKNPGGLNLTVSADTGVKSLNFSVTGAVTIISPTNPPASITPVVADSTQPLFSWNSYPQAKEYIIEVKDLSGNVIWGGYSPDGTIKHNQIPKELTSIRFNFDGKAVSQLVKGQIYQWKIYVDDNANPNVQTLLSSSEDLMGLFIAK